ncbi:D-glycerate dehydrogenase [Sediminibacillus dalangtanensis]|uniref:D-glycerate dehydrogenase n=1 Tax=Sediminibacillus dalangtanensis TaxID=2729421 RepID=A0ABX7VXG3_9BACI|nr:D-glycerate dehydrogenase [Sediminibacillus dalangtanensis]QTN00199.1 D-glycerate dehydrogenase [Sediminibacillus dalangtanensis]
MVKPYLYVTRKLPEEIIRPFRRQFDIQMWLYEEKPINREALERETKHADAILTMLSDQIDRSLLEQAENLKIIANLAVGYDNIDLSAAKDRGITVSNTPDVLTETTADLTFALLMATARRIVEAARFIEQGSWNNWAPFLMAGKDVHHKTLGIVGMGRIGEALARRARGFSMDVLYHNRSRHLQAEESLGVHYAEFESLLEQADYVVCLAPLTEETKHMFDKEAFSRMKKSAFFINASRGKNVDEKALYHALINEEIAGAGLDVFEDEPIDSSHPLLALQQVTCLPHIGSATIETRNRMIELCLENIALVLSGKKAKTLVI